MSESQSFSQYKKMFQKISPKQVVEKAREVTGYNFGRWADLFFGWAIFFGIVTGTYVTWKYYRKAKRAK